MMLTGAEGRLGREIKYTSQRPSGMCGGFGYTSLFLMITLAVGNVCVCVCMCDRVCRCVWWKEHRCMCGGECRKMCVGNKMEKTCI